MTVSEALFESGDNCYIMQVHCITCQHYGDHFLYGLLLCYSAVTGNYPTKRLLLEYREADRIQVSGQNKTAELHRRLKARRKKVSIPLTTLKNN